MASDTLRELRESFDSMVKRREQLRKDLTGGFNFPEMLKKYGEKPARHKMSDGSESLSWNLWTEEGEVSAAKWFNPKGSVFPPHEHDQREWLIVVRGTMVFQAEGEESRTLGPGDYAFHEPGTLHQAMFPEDCWFLAVTIPSSPDWPS